MDQIQLWIEGKIQKTIELGSEPIAVGGADTCELKVEGVGISENLFLIQKKHGSCMYYDLRQPIKKQSLEPFPYDSKLHVHSNCFLLRVHTSSALNKDQIADLKNREVSEIENTKTETIQRELVWDEDIGFVIGAGSDARFFRVKATPFTMGSRDQNRVVLADRAVSATHCRVEPFEQGMVIRDLGSKNGTWVNGIRVSHARIGLGSRVRLGRTDLTVVSQRKASAKSYLRKSQSKIEKQKEGAALGFSSEIVARSSCMLKVQATVLNYSSLPWPVLIQGESGTGKELIARDLHYRGSRCAGPFVAVNCGGLPHHLVESELFGHEKGAFTGAVRAHLGVFEQAQMGTLFLDEIGELPLDLQPRLLRVLETQQIRRVGGENMVDVDVRIVCATHRDLKTMVREGRFREDLHYRIAQLVVQMEPLRKRPDDILPLCEHILMEISHEVGAKVLSEEALCRVMAYHWPGNVRELRNVLINAGATSPSEMIHAVDVDRVLSQMTDSFDLNRISVEGVREVVSKYRGNMSAAARALGVPRTTLRDRLKKEKKG